MRSLLRATVASVVALVGVLLLTLLLVPLTEAGTRWLLSWLGEYTPVAIEYDSGTLLGELHLDEVKIPLDGLDMRLEGLSFGLTPGCLWNSRVCLNNLSVSHVEVHVKDSGQEQAMEAPDASPGRFEFPFAVSAPSVLIDSLRVTWPGGSWRNQRLTGAVNILNSELQIDQADVEEGHLKLDESSPEKSAQYPLLLPDIALPFTLVIDGLEFTQASYSVLGEAGKVASISLAGEWSGHTVALENFALSTQYAKLDLAGSLRMRESWWLQANTEVTLSQPFASDPLALNRLRLNLEGALAQLGWDAVVDSTESAASPVAIGLQLSGEVDATQDEFPFSSRFQAQWQGDLPVGALVPEVSLTESVVVHSPVRGSVAGNLRQQHLMLDLEASGLGYDALTLVLQSSLTESQLTIESLSLADEGTDTELRTSGVVSFNEHVDIALDVESDGMQLPGVVETLSGRIHGSTALAGSIEADRWRLSLTDLALQGTVNQLPAHVNGALSTSSDRLLESAFFDGEVNGATLRLRSDGGPESLGTLDLHVDDVGQWVPHARGQLNVSATADPKATRVMFSGDAQQLGYESALLRSMQFDGSFTLQDQWFESLSLRGTDFDVGGTRIDGLQVELKHQAASGTDMLSINTEGELGMALTLQGKGDLSDWAGALQPTEVEFSDTALSLRQALKLHWSGIGSQLTVAPHCWHLEETSACFDEAKLGSNGEVDGRVNGDLGFLADVFPQEVSVDGLLAGSVSARWSPEAAPVLKLNLAGSDIAITQDLGAGQQARIDWSSIQLDLSTGVNLSTLQMQVLRSGQSRFSIDAQMSGWGEDAPLSGSLEATDMRLDNVRPFVPQIAQLGGQIAGRAQLGGSLGSPKLVGSFLLEQGELAVVGNPTTLSDLSLDLELNGREAVLNGRGVIGEGGLVLSGLGVLDPQPSLTLNVTGDRQNLLLPPSGQALVSQALTLVATASGVELKGKITVHEGRLEHEQLPEGSVDISPDAIEVDYAGNVIQEKKPFDLTMDVEVEIENRFRVIGTNIDSTVGGDLRLRQRAKEPLELFGNLNVIGGELRAYGQSLKIKRGTVSFAGGMDNPQLNLRAERVITLEDVEVGIHLIGPLEEPELEIYSNPAMSQTEALSYLLRGRGLDAGAEGDGASVALSMGTGFVNQSGVTDSLNKIPGLNNIGFGAEGSADETAATVSGYIGERIYMSYGVGLYEPINILTARLYLQTRLWLEVVSRLENSIDLYYSFDID